MNTTKNSDKYWILLIFLTLSLAGGFYHFYQKNNAYPDAKHISGIDNIIPVLILGSGPAGLSAAVYTSRAKIPTVVLTGAQPGGQLADVKYIENWPAREKNSGMKIMDDLQAQAEHFGTKVMYDAAKAIDLSNWPFIVHTENDLILRPLALVFATGGTPKKLYVPGVAEHWGKGVGICTLCDAPFHKGQIVAVVGGSDTAGERVLQLSAYAKKVYMIVREPQLEACATVKEYLKDLKNLTILLDTEVTEILGNNDSVSAIKIKDLKSGKESEIALQGIYFAIGYHPNSDLVKSYVKTDKDGYILVKNNGQHTKIPGFFAAGVVAASDKNYGKSGVAAGSGIKAGIDVINFIENIGLTADCEKKLEKHFFMPKSDGLEKHTVDNVAELKDLYNKSNHKPILLYIHSKNCPHCRSIEPILHDIFTQYGEKLIIAQADVDSPVIHELNVHRVPYFVFFKKGSIVWHGSRTTKEALIRELENFMKAE